MKNYPRPWKYYLDAGIVDCNEKPVSFGRNGWEFVVNCVNACAGMDDPVADVAELKHKSTENALQNEYMKAALNTLMGLLCDAADSGDHGKSLDSMVSYGKSILTGGADLTALKKAVENVVILGFKPNFEKDSCVYDFSEFKNFGRFPAEPSWHDLGILPPVGTVCEMQDDKGGWITAEIIAHKSRYAFGWCANKEMVYFSPFPHEFRPIQTEKQKTIAAMLPLVADLDGTQSQAEIACEKIYDQFIAK